MKNYKIAVFGSANLELNPKTKKLAFDTGREITKNGYTLITGAASGISEEAARGAKSENGIVIGVSPSANDNEIKKYNVSTKNIDYLIHTGMGYKGRNVITVRTCDAMIILNGQLGTLNEATIGEGENKPIIAVEGSGGCADILNKIFKAIKPDSKLLQTAKTPKEAVEKAIKLING